MRLEEMKLNQDELDKELLEQARDIVTSEGRASTSLIQRKLSVGYSRAARIVDMLEAEGFVDKADGSKPRELLKVVTS